VKNQATKIIGEMTIGNHHTKSNGSRQPTHSAEDTTPTLTETA